jgi:dsDNA-binding SOS-regulon protein
MNTTMDKAGAAWQKYLPKAVVLSSLLKHCKDHLKIRDELRNFLAEMKDDSRQITKELKKEDKVTRNWYIRRRSSCAVHGLKHRDTSANTQVSQVEKAATVFN